MKKQLYRRTKAGIRIPKEKNKWMAPIEEGTPDTPKLPAPADKDRSDLLIRNFNFFLQSGRSAESDWGGEYFGEEGM